MSYCVNCGVELENGCGACPLCDTPIINPRESGGKSQNPENFNIPESADKRYFVFVVSIAMLIPNIVLSVLDFAFFHTGAVTYIASASALIWIWFLFPLLWKKPLPLLLLTLDAASLAAFLNLIRKRLFLRGYVDLVFRRCAARCGFSVGGFGTVYALAQKAEKQVSESHCRAHGDKYCQFCC